MGNHVEGLLSLSRCMQNPLSITTVDLSEMATDIANSLADDYPKREVQIQIAAGLFVQGDSDLLQTAMEHLIGNAWKFTSKTKGAKITVAQLSQNGQTCYTISDNGVGFDMSHKDMLFRPFYSLHSPGEYEDSGVGLALVKRIIARHGGEIWAKGEVGRGATIYFTLAGQQGKNSY
ncbi:MAG: hypothetical protein HQL69_10910 [Magnetococcales bacterium]|nr:hypothetical protein [Magnetococcales bacterium]